MNKLYYLLIFIPISFLLHFANLGGSSVQFFVSALAIIPLAGLLGEGTEELSKYTGSQFGAFLNATFGNATELIMCIFALRAGLFEVVKASIAGAMIGNILLVLGAAMLCGGIKYETQRFSKAGVNVSLSMLTVAVISIVIPAVFTNNLSLTDNNPIQLEGLSIAIAFIMLFLYLASLYFSFFTHKDIYEVEHETIKSKWSLKLSIIILLLATLFVAVESEFLVSNIEPMTQQLHLSKLFVGLIIIPIIGNAAEHFTAILVAMKNKMDIAVGIAVGSSLQIILFVAPILVLISLFFKPMILIFNEYEIVSLGIATLIANKVCQDGESNWLEGLQLICLYIILAAAFFIL